MKKIKIKKIKIKKSCTIEEIKKGDRYIVFSDNLKIRIAKISDGWVSIFGTNNTITVAKISDGWVHNYGTNTIKITKDLRK